jgi:hypothetical protein
MNRKTEKPFPEEIAEARLIPNGWVYRVGGCFRQDEHVPPEAIVGAWQVNSEGIIIGGFIKNDRYDPSRWPAST